MKHYSELSEEDKAQLQLLVGTMTADAIQLVAASRDLCPKCVAGVMHQLLLESLEEANRPDKKDLN